MKLCPRSTAVDQGYNLPRGNDPSGRRGLQATKSEPALTFGTTSSPSATTAFNHQTAGGFSTNREIMARAMTELQRHDGRGRRLFSNELPRMCDIGIHVQDPHPHHHPQGGGASGSQMFSRSKSLGSTLQSVTNTTSNRSFSADLISESATDYGFGKEGFTDGGDGEEEDGDGFSMTEMDADDGRGLVLDPGSLGGGGGRGDAEEGRKPSWMMKRSRDDGEDERTSVDADGMDLDDGMLGGDTDVEDEEGGGGQQVARQNPRLIASRRRFTPSNPNPSVNPRRHLRETRSLPSSFPEFTIPPDAFSSAVLLDMDVIPEVSESQGSQETTATLTAARVQAREAWETARLFGSGAEEF